MKYKVTLEYFEFGMNIDEVHIKETVSQILNSVNYCACILLIIQLLQYLDVCSINKVQR